MNRRFAPKCSTSTGIGVQHEQESLFNITGIRSEEVYNAKCIKNRYTLFIKYKCADVLTICKALKVSTQST